MNSGERIKYYVASGTSGWDRELCEKETEAEQTWVKPPQSLSIFSPQRGILLQHFLELQRPCSIESTKDISPSTEHNRLACSIKGLATGVGSSQRFIRLDVNEILGSSLPSRFLL